MYRPKVFIADDHALIRAAFQKLLEQECDVVGCAADGRALLEAAPQLQPDIIVLDIAMPLLNGLDAGSQIKRLMPSVKLIFLTVNEDPEVVRHAFRLGASGYLHKNSVASELFQAIHNVMCGRTYITPLIAPEGKDLFLRESPHHRAMNEPTMRQREVLQLLSEGHSMKQVAAILHVKPRTVAFHKYRLMEEFKLKNNASLIQFGMRHGLDSC
ncbi:MAG: response regulator transcription factor [Nitrospira sp.]